MRVPALHGAKHEAYSAGEDPALSGVPELRAGFDDGRGVDGIILDKI